MSLASWLDVPVSVDVVFPSEPLYPSPTDADPLSDDIGLLASLLIVYRLYRDFGAI